jgi:hypothetical protein
MRIRQIAIAVTMIFVCLSSYADLFGDVDETGAIDAIDIQRVVNAVLGLSNLYFCDLDLSDSADAVDVQLIINIALGLFEPGSGVSAIYDPAKSFSLNNGRLYLAFPHDALHDRVRIKMRQIAQEELPHPIGGDIEFLGAEFGPEGLVFRVPGTIETHLSSPSPLRSLPVLTYDFERGRWTGTDTLAEIRGDGSQVIFPIQHFSWVGVPDGIPSPPFGQFIPDSVELKSVYFESSVFVSQANITLSKSDHSFLLIASGASRGTKNGEKSGVQELRLEAIEVREIDRTIVAIFAGPISGYYDGQVRESIVGSLAMAKSNDRFTAAFCVASTNRVIFGKCRQ